MFTPQREGRSGWALSPRTDVSANPRNAGKGKGVVSVEVTPPPPLASLGENGANAGPGEETEVWRRFREAGLMDEGSLEKKDREALLKRILKLEGELYDYQYNMGLLLIEKKEWNVKFEELRQALDEAEEIVKREQAARSIALSELEKQGENLRKALEVEKQCVSDLERALHDLRSESAVVKVTSDGKLAEAQALVARVEEKSLEVEAKLRAADVKLAEADRKSSELDRKLHELESRESVLRRERLSFNAEKEAHESALLKQREDLREWEKKLQEGQQRLGDGQGLLNHREDRANEKDKVLNQKEKALEEKLKNIESANSALKDKEANISVRLTTLVAKEEEAAKKKKDLEVKEQELHALEEKLNAREQVEIQNLIDEHNALLDVKKKDFELEMDQKRKAVDMELKSKVDALEQKDVEVNHKEDKLIKREQALEKKAEKLKEKEKDYDSKLKALKEREKSVKAEEKALEVEKKRAETEKQELLNLRAELANDRAALEEQEQRILKEQESLKVTEDDRREHLLLQSELKMEIEENRLQKELFMKEREDLKRDRKEFEREWEVLDEKKIFIENERNQLKEEKEMFSKWKEDEEERLKSEKLTMEGEVQREREALQLQRVSFAATMEHERSELFEKVRRERDDMIRGLELQKHKFETQRQSQQEEREKQLHDKDRAFDEEKNREMNHIKLLREQAEREKEEMVVEKLRLEREKHEIFMGRKQVEQSQLEIQNDIEVLNALSRKVRDQREQFLKERSQFLASVERNKSCGNCGNMVLSDFQPVSGMEDVGINLQSRFPEGYVKDAVRAGVPDLEVTPEAMGSDSGGRMKSWFQKCTSKIKIFSPVRRIDGSPKNLVGSQVGREIFKRLDEPEPSMAAAGMRDTVNIERINSENSNREMESGPVPSNDEQSDMARSQGFSEILYASPESAEPKPTASKRSQRKTGRKGGKLRATRSVKQVIEESKAILGESQEENNNEEQPDELALVNEESRGDSLREDGKVSNVGRKRQHGTMTIELDGAESETHSESVTTRGRRKRRQTVATGFETPGGKRYNLRRSTVVGSAASAHTEAEKKDHHQQPLRSAASAHAEAEKEDHHQQPLLEGNKDREGGQWDVGSIPKPTEPHLEIAGQNGTRTGMLHKTMIRSDLEIHEERSQKATRLETGESAGGVETNAVEGAEENGAGEGAEENGEDGYETDVAAYLDESEDDSEKHNASIGKKLWSFFTT